MKTKELENLHRVRYIEIFVWGGNLLSGNLVANVYDTTAAVGFDPNASKDSAPPTYVDGVNLEEIGVTGRVA